MENGVLQVVIVDILLLVFCRYTNLIVESLNRILPVKFSFPLKEAPLGMAGMTSSKTPTPPGTWVSTTATCAMR